MNMGPFVLVEKRSRGQHTWGFTQGFTESWDGDPGILKFSQNHYDSVCRRDERKQPRQPEVEGLRLFVDGMKFSKFETQDPNSGPRQMTRVGFARKGKRNPELRWEWDAGQLALSNDFTFGVEIQPQHE